MRSVTDTGITGDVQEARRHTYGSTVGPYPFVRSLYIYLYQYLAASSALFRSCMLPSLLSRGLCSPTRAMGLSRIPVHSLSYKGGTEEGERGLRGAGRGAHTRSIRRWRVLVTAHGVSGLFDVFMHSCAMCVLSWSVVCACERAVCVSVAVP